MSGTAASRAGPGRGLGTPRGIAFQYTGCRMHRPAVDTGPRRESGTPVGVGIGFKPPKYLVAGDVVRVEIDGIGSLENSLQ